MSTRAIHIACCFLLLFTSTVWAQDKDRAIGEEYFKKGDYQKAVSYFERFLKSNQQEDVYEKYRHCLVQLDELDQLEKFLKKELRKQPESIKYRIDKAVLIKLKGNVDTYNQTVASLIHDFKTEDVVVYKAAAVLKQRGDVDNAVNLYLEARKVRKDPVIYAEELSGIYLTKNDKKRLAAELLSYLENKPSKIEYVQSMMQTAFVNEDDQDFLIDQIYLRVGGPAQSVMNELLMWLYVQKRDFYNAFVQARSMDKQDSGLRGKGLRSMGEIAMKNYDFENAITIFQYVTEHYPNDYNYSWTKQKMIKCKEEIAKSTYPVDKPAIEGLIKDYEALLERTAKPNAQIEIKRSMAQLYAFYLNDVKQALVLLNEAVKIPRVHRTALAECKLDLADIYLLDDQPWEASLFYSQVEKDLKDTRIAHEAKLRNSKLWYFMGDFELAQSHLDVLKLATTREIANDAMDLSLLIQDNLALDTSDAALKEYSEIELMIYRMELDPALERLEAMLTTFDGHTLTDEVYWSMAMIYSKMGRFDQAYDQYAKIVDGYKYDILSDDAQFCMAVLLQEKLKRPEDAMEAFKNILIDFPGSIYVAEARKRYRILRGDTVN